MENMVDTESIKNKISVIIPVYNCAQWIEQTIQDLLEQTYKQFEIILINDGSTDDSGKVCDRYALLDSRIRVFHTVNQGVSSARNLGLKKASGSFIRFIDADDRIPPHSLDVLMNPCIDNEDVELVIGRFNTDKNLWQSRYKGYADMNNLMEDMSHSIHGFYYGVLWNKLYKKSIIDKEELCFREDLSWCEDYLFNLQYISHVRNNIFYVASSIYDYITHANSLTNKVNLSERNRVEDLCLQQLEHFYVVKQEICENNRFRNAMFHHFAYIKHSQMCNLCRENVLYREFAMQCLDEKSLVFWKDYDNTEKVWSYRTIIFFLSMHSKRGVFFYVLLKEKLKSQNKTIAKYMREHFKRGKYHS